MMKIPENYVGKWKITHMDQWDQNVVDLVVPGHVTIQTDGTGFFEFGAVRGDMDCRIEKMGKDFVLGFSWDGSDEGDSASGRGWVKVDGNQMEGHLFFHLGDDSAFAARKEK